MSRVYDQIYDGEWSDWPRDLHFQCCSCGFTHQVQLRIRSGKIQIRMTVDNRSTAATRRAEGITVKKKKKRKTAPRKT